MNYLLLLPPFLTVLLVQLFYYYRLKKLEHKLDGILESKVGDVLNALKQEIPLASTFLRGSIEQKLHAKALLLVKKIIPEMKAKGKDYSLVWVPLLIALGMTGVVWVLLFNL